MSISKRALIQGLFLFCVVLTGVTRPSASAAEERTSALHWSGDKTNFDLKTNTVELIGNAAVHMNQESLYADRIVLERDSKVVHAVGNTSFVGRNSLIQAQEMHFNLETRTGTIVNGRVSTQNFTLSGEQIHKLGANRFQVYRGEYSTCKDCPNSWSFEARDVDLEIEGYARLTGVTAKINDAPALWIPYIVVPIKTQRQTGLLIPRFGSGTAGFFLVQPFFWATSRSTDMTLGIGSYGGRGRRLEWEGRYALDNGDGIANFWHLTDRTFRDYLKERGYLNREGFTTNRWAVQVDQKQELPFGIFEKFRFREISDNLYPSLIGDINPGSNPYLTSDVSLTHTTDKVSIYASASRYRNLLNRSDSTAVTNQLLNEDPREFDNSTVQVLPQVVLTTNDKLFFDNRVAAGVSFGFTEFNRASGPFDRDQIRSAVGEVAYKPPADGCSGTGFCLGQDPLREAARFTVNPNVSTTLRPFDVLTLVPSVEYKHYIYNFHGAAPNLNRGYLQVQTDLSTQLERVYDTGNPDVPRMKHLFRPKLGYSLIPYRREPNHPFVRQIEYARLNNVTGYNFDSEDVVPLDASTNYQNYFQPLGHSLSYGFTNQLIRRRGAVGTQATYERSVEWTAGQAVNFREFKKESEDQKPLSRVFSLINVGFDRISGHADYYYTPYQPFDQFTSRHVYSTGLKFTLDKEIRHEILEFERSVWADYGFNRSSSSAQSENVSGGIIWSINDYIIPSFSFQYNLVGKRWQQTQTRLSFQSPSQCWKLDLMLNGTIRERERPDDKAWANTFQFNLSLNLTGSGYGSVTGAPQQ